MALERAQINRRYTSRVHSWKNRLLIVTLLDAACCAACMEGYTRRGRGWWKEGSPLPGYESFWKGFVKVRRRVRRDRLRRRKQAASTTAASTTAASATDTSATDTKVA